MSCKDGFPNSHAAATGDADIAHEDTMMDLSGQCLTSIPEFVNNYAISSLYLQNNNIEAIPDQFFPSLPALMWLDLRDNKISKIPETIRFHPCLSHMLLQNNQLTALPNEIGTLANLQTVKVSGNPMVYPPKDIVDLGSKVIIKFLKAKLEEEFTASTTEETESQTTFKTALPCRSESDISLLNMKKNMRKNMSVRMSEKELWQFEKMYPKSSGKCPKLATSRLVLPRYGQSRKYLEPQRAASKDEQTLKIRQNLLRELAQKKTQEMLEARDKILQDRKNMNMLKDWRNNYRQSQFRSPQRKYKLDPNTIPYDTDPDRMVLLSRKDIEKDLPDKYRKMLPRKCKVAMPRKRSGGDAVLASKIQQLFANLEKINLNRESMTPRTEQRMLMNEINKISEIKRKLADMSYVNFKNTLD